MAKKLIACLIAVIMVITAGTAVFAAKGATDVNVAVGKTVVSSNFGTGGYNEHVVGNTIDGNHGTMFIPTISRQQTELVTIDLGQRFPITQVIMSKWGGKTGGSYGSGDSVFEIYASNSWSGDNHDELTNPVKFTGDADFTKVDPSGNDDSEHIMNFIPGSVAKYRYVQLKYVRAQENPSVQPRITEIEVYAPAESVNQTIVPVSVGKPIYSEFNGTSWGTELYMINDGDTSTTYHAYGANDTSADMIIDLENKYPITKVTHTPGYLASGSIDGVYASNDPSFASYAVFDYDSGDGAWYIDDGEAALFGDEFKYIKIDWSVAPVTSSDSTPGLWSQAEITVYSTEEAAEKAVSSKTNIALGKTVTSKIYGHNDGLAALTDGDTTGNEFINYATASTQGEYYDIDLGNAYTITNIKTYHNSYHAASVGAVWVSNDPGFDRHETFTTLGYRTSHDADPVKFNSTPSALSEEMKGYRYVRIFEPDNGSGSNPWRIREIEIYVPTSETLCENRALGKNVTLIGSDGNEITSDYFGMSKGNFNDGNESTEGGLSNGAAIIELDYPQEIEWVEVIIRAYPGDDNKKGYKVYLSNEKSVNTANALQIGDTDESPVYSAGETLRYNSNSETKYKYILVKGYNSGECIAKEIKVMGDDVITGTTITNKLTGTKANGEILTLNTGYTGAAAIDKVLNLYIARYDNGVLTDIVKSGDLLFRGNIVDETLTYTITEDVTPQTQFKGFAWEKNSLAPFADNAEIATEYWVDPNAAVNGNGSKNSPFNSITAARNAVREVNGDMDGDIVVNLTEGKYYVDNSNYIYFNTDDGGSNGYNVIYRNAPGETAVISGGRPITGFAEGENGIWYAAANDFDSIYELTVNGVAASLAATETPVNASKFYGSGSDGTYSGYSGGIGFSKSSLPAITNPGDAFVHVASSWVDVMYKVSNVQDDGSNYKYVVDSARLKATTKNTLLSANHTVIDTGDKFYIENAKELLDQPGEFYFDRNSKILYYKPRSGENMSTAVVEAAISDSLVNISGTRDNHVKNLILSGLKFENATYANMYAQGFTTAQAQVVKFDTDTFIQGSVWVNYADNIEISDCEFTGITKPCISFVEGVLDSTVTRNKFTDIGNSAVVVGTNNHEALEYAGEERCERNTISDNIISKPALKIKGSPAVTCYYVVDTDIIHNKIKDCNYSGISLGWGWANYPDLDVCVNNRVANNYIENINLTAADGGAVYTLGNLPGALIEGNYYVQTVMPEQTSGIIGIYADEGTQNVTARSNVIDMADIRAYGGDIYAIGAWTSSIKNFNATGNYATLTTINNDGTNCNIETPTAYTKGSEPAAVSEIIAASAQNLR